MTKTHGDTAQQALFDTTPVLPEGFAYVRELITPPEEAELLHIIGGLPLEEAKYKEYTAKRRTLSYGSQYDFGRNALDTVDAIPAFLWPLREQVAKLAGVEPSLFVQGLVSEYRPDTQLGWHRDVPNFEVIAGVSLGGAARMRLRPYRPGQKNRREDVLAVDLAPRSAYVMRDAARWGWQHSIAPTREHRHSITFRTLRRRA